MRNAVLIMHGTGGSGTQFVRSDFAGALFGPGALLDAARYFIILPDDIGHRQSSKPSDGLHTTMTRDLAWGRFVLHFSRSTPPTI